MFSAPHQYQVNQTVWVFFPEKNSIQQGRVLQLTINLFLDNDQPQQVNKYIVNNFNTKGNYCVDENNVYGVLQDALDALGNDITING